MLSEAMIKMRVFLITMSSWLKFNVLIYIKLRFGLVLEIIHKHGHNWIFIVNIISYFTLHLEVYN